MRTDVLSKDSHPLNQFAKDASHYLDPTALPGRTYSYDLFTVNSNVQSAKPVMSIAAVQVPTSDKLTATLATKDVKEFDNATLWGAPTGGAPMGWVVSNGVITPGLDASGNAPIATNLFGLGYPVNQDMQVSATVSVTGWDDLLKAAARNADLSVQVGLGFQAKQPPGKGSGVFLIFTGKLGDGLAAPVSSMTAIVDQGGSPLSSGRGLDGLTGKATYRLKFRIKKDNNKIHVIGSVWNDCDPPGAAVTLELANGGDWPQKDTWCPVLYAVTKKAPGIKMTFSDVVVESLKTVASASTTPPPALAERPPQPRGWEAPAPGELVVIAPAAHTPLWIGLWGTALGQICPEMPIPACSYPDFCPTQRPSATSSCACVGVEPGTVDGPPLPVSIPPHAPPQPTPSVETQEFEPPRHAPIEPGIRRASVADRRGRPSPYATGMVRGVAYQDAMPANPAPPPRNMLSPLGDWTPLLEGRDGEPADRSRLQPDDAHHGPTCTDERCAEHASPHYHPLHPDHGRIVPHPRTIRELRNFGATATMPDLPGTPANPDGGITPKPQAPTRSAWLEGAYGGVWLTSAQAPAKSLFSLVLERLAQALSRALGLTPDETTPPAKEGAAPGEPQAKPDANTPAPKQAPGNRGGPKPPGPTQPSRPPGQDDDDLHLSRDSFPNLPTVTILKVPAPDDDESQMPLGPPNPRPKTNRLIGENPQAPYWTYPFDLPARFPLTKFGSRCCAFEGDGAVIHEGMRLLARVDGQYEVRFNVTTPAMPVMLKLQLILFERLDSPGLDSRPYVPKTLTLPPIWLRPWDSDPFPDARDPGEGIQPPSYLVSVRGYSQVIKEIHAPDSKYARDGKRNFLVVKRIGTARFGSGVRALKNEDY
ncbi:MAG TPA: hypothetical protein VG406_17705 [Isosphaeraceae bacterium]|nr:hypothetical protein [Isosphaeraceae bacterium]